MHRRCGTNCTRRRRWQPPRARIAPSWAFPTAQKAPRSPRRRPRPSERLPRSFNSDARTVTGKGPRVRSERRFLEHVRPAAAGEAGEVAALEVFLDHARPDFAVDVDAL